MNVKSPKELLWEHLQKGHHCLFTLHDARTMTLDDLKELHNTIHQDTGKVGE
jgi:hypothetical protein